MVLFGFDLSVFLSSSSWFLLVDFFFLSSQIHLVDAGGNIATQDKKKAEVLHTFSALPSKAICSLNAHLLELEDRDG